MKITKLHQSSGKSAGIIGQPVSSWIVSEAKGKTCTGVWIQVSQDQAFEKVIGDSGAWKRLTQWFSGSCGW